MRSTADETENLRLVNLLVLSMPPAHQEPLVYLMRVLGEIAADAATNKMSAEYGVHDVSFVCHVRVRVCPVPVATTSASVLR
jgi:hypothetical protein